LTPQASLGQRLCSEAGRTVRERLICSERLRDEYAAELVASAGVRSGSPAIDLGAGIDVTDLRPPNQDFRVIANPPFASLASVLRLLTSSCSRMVRADLVVPAHVAAR
jgi:hypothetical protein